MEAAPPRPEGIEACLRTLDLVGPCANERSVPVPSTLATAAAAVVLAEIGRPPPPGAGSWLAGEMEGGGFRAFPGAPEPDLLSTASAIHALAVIGAIPAGAGGAVRDFALGLRDGEGGFKGHRGDEADAEYTFYGLLALGHGGPP